jgi:biotin carboxylase
VSLKKVTGTREKYHTKVSGIVFVSTHSYSHIQKLHFAMAPIPDPPSATLTRAWVPTDLPSPVSVIFDQKTVVLIDPLSTGVLLQQRLFDAGYRIILVWSNRSQPAAREKHFLRSGHPKEDFDAVIVHQEGHLPVTLKQILAITSNITAVMCGSEFGVLLEDAVADGLNAMLGTTHLKSSGLPCTKTKVDKYAQANQIRKAGLAAVREKLAMTEQDVVDFLADKQGNDLQFVVKPQTGAGSVGVTFCDSKQAVWDAYHSILAGEHKAHCGDKYRHYSQAGVLLQEYLEGTEYIVNAVVHNGVIKTTAMFQYDKRPYNGAAFVCFSKELLVIGDNPQLLEVLEYTEQVLQAVGFQNGAVHAEIMHTVNRGPVLVEINCRLHGGNAQWVYPAEICMGYNQLSVYMDVYLDGGKNDFANIPSRPEKAHRYCHQVKMRSHLEGTLDCVIQSQMDRIMALPSYLEHSFAVRPGDRLIRTVDMPSVPGEVTLVHEDRAALAADYNELNHILREGIFQVLEE